MANKVEQGRRYFTIRAAPGNLVGFIPKNTPILLDVLQWAATDLNRYIKDEGFQVEVDDAQFVAFRRLLRKHPNGFKEDYELLFGVLPTEPEQPRLEWLADSAVGPHDLVMPNVPFLRVVAPRPPREGRDIYGHLLLPKVRETPTRIHLQPDDEITTLDEEHYVCTSAGQVAIEGQRLRFNSSYVVTEIGAPWMRKMCWTCSVAVKCDLDGGVEWEVHGNLLVEGHWSAGNVTVHGNVRARSGIQTNMVGVIKIHGNADVAFVQMSKLGVKGNLTIDRAALQSELRVGGELRLPHEPGSLMGCTVHGFGGMYAQRVGSEKGQRTSIHLYDNDDGGGTASRITKLSAGTIMEVGARKWTQAEDGYFSTLYVPPGEGVKDP